MDLRHRLEAGPFLKPPTPTMLKSVLERPQEAALRTKHSEFSRRSSSGIAQPSGNSFWMADQPSVSRGRIPEA